MLKKQFLILLIIFWSQNSSGFMTSLWEAAQSGRKILRIITDPAFSDRSATNLHDLFNRTNAHNESFTKYFHQMQKHLEKTQHVDIEGAVSRIVHMSPRDIMISEFWDLVGNLTGKLNKYMNEFSPIDELENFTSKIISEVEKKLDTFREKLNPKANSEHSSLFFSLVAQEYIAADDDCGMRSTLQDALMALFRTQVVSDIHATILIALAYWYIHYQYSPGSQDWKFRIEKLQTRQAIQFIGYFEHLYESLQQSNISYHRACEQLHGWKKDETYSMLPLIEQKLLVQRSFCACEIFDGTPFQQACSFTNNLTKTIEHPTHCERLSEPVVACRRNQTPFEYDYIQSANKGVQGLHKSCPDANVHAFETANLFYDSHRSTPCSCMVNNLNVRVYLGLIESQKNNNYVIVGLRFRVAVNSTLIYLQAATAKLEPNGATSNTTWLPLPHKYKSDLRNQEKLTAQRRSFFLDDLKLPSGYALTGFKFNAVNRRGVLGFSIEIRGIPFNYETGELLTTLINEKTVVPSESGPEKSLEYTAANPLFTHFDGVNYNSEGSTFVELRQASLTTDFGQTTVPVFNNIGVHTGRSSPLAGFGIFHRGHEAHAGFIAPRLYPADFSSYVDNFIEKNRLRSSYYT